MPLLNHFNPIAARWSMCYYGGKEADYLSKEIIRFKNGYTRSISTWNTLAAEFLKAKLKTQPKMDLIIRALGSSELTAETKKPLHRFCVQLSKDLGIPFVPNSISKSRVTKSFAKERLNKMQRFAELNGVFNISDNPILSKKNILLVDDVATSSATSVVIARAIQAKFGNSVNIYLFTLAHTNYDLDNDHAFEEKYKAIYNDGLE